MVEGLQPMDYLGKLCKKDRFTEQGDVDTFEVEDGVYLGSPNIVDVLHHERKWTYVIRREGLTYVAFDTRLFGALCIQGLIRESLDLLNKWIHMSIQSKHEYYA
ncbi:Aldose 1-/Glucose-6-phosphate 1-epimerase [Artemisia annua]|uniref:Aldose 1-/Glucose-6-phosphate 1-epimerase n=1 Tax=Artemisia annua TaxID=35608 RepID=A0A2U1NYS2_ARTAN|nr:Aldose 1-/Glucose-6-phosphate 1-epimerase [Artemisia annua]